MNAHLLCVDVRSHVDFHICGAWFVELGWSLQRPTDSLCGKHSNNWKKTPLSSCVSKTTGVQTQPDPNLSHDQIVDSHGGCSKSHHSPFLIIFITSHNHSWGEEMTDFNSETTEHWSWCRPYANTFSVSISVKVLIYVHGMIINGLSCLTLAVLRQNLASLSHVNIVNNQ